MLIKHEALAHWMDNFYGYGSWRAAVWFISYEEPGGDLPEEVADRINYFSALPGSGAETASERIGTAGRVSDDLCDIRELYSRIVFRNEGPRSSRFNNHFDYRFGDHAVLHGIWKNLIAFAHGVCDIPVPDLLTYQQNEFASPLLRREALIPFYPLPSPHDHAWYYSWLDMPSIPYLKVRASYESHMYDVRIRTIMENLARYEPRTVLMYEMSNINKLKSSVTSYYPAADFKMIKAIRQVIPQHHRVQLGRTTLLITTQVPALKHNRKDTGFDWKALGEMTRHASASH